MRTRESLLTLMQELKGDMVELARLGELNKRALERIEVGAKDVLDYGALAFTIHNLYGVIENYFLRISKFFENTLPPDSWHKTLVDRMALDIPGLRPALIIDTELKSQIMELLKFRHKVRNLYGEDLKPEKTMVVEDVARRVIENFRSVHEEFLKKLGRISEKL